MSNEILYASRLAKVKNVSRAFLRDSAAISNYSTRARLINARSDKCSMLLPRYRISRRSKKEIVIKIRYVRNDAETAAVTTV